MTRFSTSLLGEARTLLLATDGSHYSDGALQEAIFFGQACAARVVVLHVVETTAESLKSANSKVMRRQQELAPYMEYVRKMAQDSGVEYEIVVVGSTRPEKTIVEQARLRKADVILMGRHGKAGRLALLVGSMTAKVIELGFPMVLVVPKDFSINGAHVLLAVDDSPSSRLVMEEALSMGQCCSTLEKMTVVSVAAKETGLQDAQTLVEEFCTRARAAWPNIRFESAALVGDPARTIVQTADERKADMIMIGGMGKRRLPKLFMGRVAKEVCGQAHCAVLMVTA